MKKQKNKNTINKIFIIAVCAFLIIYAMSILFILAWGLMTSLKSYTDYQLAGNKIGIPSLEHSKEELFKLANYKKILDEFIFPKTISFYQGGKLVKHSAEVNVGTMIFNTVIYAGFGAFIHAMVPCWVAYLCAKYKFAFSEFLYSLCLVIMIIPIVGASTSEITVLRKLGLYDTWAGHFIQKFNFTGMYFFVFYAFFESLPDSYVEAAEVDGAGQGKIFLQIILPLAIKMVSTVTLLTFVQMWNEYQVPLLYMPTHPTLAYGVYYMVFQNSLGSLSRLPIKIAGCMFLAVPILILFICMKDKLMGNVSMGGLKE